ncbi:Protein ERGIC-53 [Tritrichomonas musculus]|uniref:Protein ERGIC-53 n=1 Tax=Tritrichomonas musculus TaxID=1915356 RepID=A0ABR2JWX8_9EUKA
MLIQFFFLKSASQSINADLNPPFISFDNKQIGVWTIGGVSLIYNDYIILAPPLQYHRGSIWSSAQIPSNDWSMQVELSLSEGSGGGGFGIWLIEEYGKEGQLSGGPSDFTGISIIGERNQSYINLKFLSDPIKRNKTIEIINSKLILYMQFSYSFIKIAMFHPITKQFTSIMNITNHFDFSSSFIGITAQSDEYTSLITLQSVTFHINDEREAFEFNNQFLKNEDIQQNDDFLINNSCKKSRKPPNDVDDVAHFQPKIAHRLRNPAFLSTRTEILQMEALNGKMDSQLSEPTKVSHVLNVIDEINEVSFGVASFSDLNNFIDLTIIPYAQKWNKRTQQIVDYAKNARSITDDACQTAQKFAQEISYLKNKTFFSIDKSVSAFSAEIEENLLTSSMIHPESIKNDLKVDYVSHILLLIGIIEFIIAFLFGFPFLYWLVKESSVRSAKKDFLINREKPD